MTQWQDISTAPRDGTEVLVWSEKQDNVYLAVFDDGQWWTPDIRPAAWTELLAVPTHWMPLPPPTP
jgi:hypothetical protein